MSLNVAAGGQTCVVDAAGTVLEALGNSASLKSGWFLEYYKPG